MHCYKDIKNRRRFRYSIYNMQDEAEEDMSKKGHRILFWLNIVQRIAMIIALPMFLIDQLYSRLRMITVFVCFAWLIISFVYDWEAHRLFKCASCGCNYTKYVRKVLDYETGLCKSPKLLICPKCGAKWDFEKQSDEDQ